MKIKIITVGNKPDSWLQEGIKKYIKKFPNYTKIEWTEIKPEKKFSSIENKKKDEAIRIKAHINDSPYICLDEHGDSLSSLNFSKKLNHWLQNFPSIIFVIGGADGIDKKLLGGSLENISLSKMTLPHHTVKLILIEQLFRAFAILNNHPYHRE
ncbi:23S rRNA (pseudouridine(1915)-N(3))-methyltransferase RlmH [Methylophilaceae bacterium]|nr:23S rRNA (pseudouridine(1915)-N(3))-methyltransferase RlmH [Methylophilaceae bacterium]